MNTIVAKPESFKMKTTKTGIRKMRIYKEQNERPTKNERKKMKLQRNSRVNRQ